VYLVLCWRSSGNGPIAVCCLFLFCRQVGSVQCLQLVPAFCTHGPPWQPKPRPTTVSKPLLWLRWLGQPKGPEFLPAPPKEPTTAQQWRNHQFVSRSRHLQFEYGSFFALLGVTDPACQSEVERRWSRSRAEWEWRTALYNPASHHCMTLTKPRATMWFTESAEQPGNG
jgi:hypothetical protein